jgi:hypothetical protein
MNAQNMHVAYARRQTASNTLTQAGNCSPSNNSGGIGIAASPCRNIHINVPPSMVLVGEERVLFVRVSVVSLPTRVSVEVGKEIVPVFTI